MNEKYIIEKSILDICEKKLKNLEKNNLEIEYLKPNLDTDTLWNSWTTFRSKSIYQDTLSMGCLLYTSPSPRDRTRSRMPSSA